MLGYTKNKPVKYIVFSEAASSISGSDLDFTHVSAFTMGSLNTIMSVSISPNFS